MLDPLSYAELWIRDGGTLPGTPAYARLDRRVARRLRRPRASRRSGSATCCCVVRSDAPTLERYERLGQPLPVGASLGRHLGDALAAHDRLAALDDAGLAASVLVVAPDVTEARHHLPGDEAPQVIELRQGGGFGRTLQVDPGTAALVGACDGDLAVGVLIDAIAELLEVDAARAARRPAAAGARTGLHGLPAPALTPTVL